MVRYGTSARSDGHSGVYLFIPDGEAHEVSVDPTRLLVRLQRGPLLTQLDVVHEIYALQYRLAQGGSLELSATTHLQMKTDTELALRFSTRIQNQAEFFTDLNGFQVVTNERVHRALSFSFDVDDTKEDIR